MKSSPPSGSATQTGSKHTVCLGVVGAVCAAAAAAARQGFLFNLCVLGLDTDQICLERIEVITV